MAPLGQPHSLRSGGWRGQTGCWSPSEERWPERWEEAGLSLVVAAQEGRVARKPSGHVNTVLNAVAP